MSDNKQGSEMLDNFQQIAETMAKGKSKKVVRGEYQEGFKVLGPQIFPNMEIPFTESELKSLGVEFISEWIASNWQLLNENEKKVFWKELSNSFGAKKSCRRFFIVLSHAFLSVDENEAIIPLSILFKQEIKGAKDFPLNREIIDWIRNLFFKEKKIGIDHLCLDPNGSEVKQVALYSIACAFVSTNKNKLELHWQFKVIKWISNSGLKFQVPDYLMQDVQNSILSQDKVMSAEVQRFLPGFPNTITFGVEPKRTNSSISTPSKDPEPEKNGKKQNQLLITSSTEPKTNDKSKKTYHEDSHQNTNIKKKTIAPSTALKALQRYVEESGAEIKEQTQEIKKISLDNKNLKKKNSTMLDEESDLKDKLDLVKNRLTQSQSHSKTLQTKIHFLETELAKAEEETHRLKGEMECNLTLMESEKNHQQEELKRLAGKITIAANNRETELLNRLSYSLRSEYGDLSHIQNMEMSVQNGEKLRALLNRIFSNLQDAGMQF